MCIFLQEHWRSYRRKLWVFTHFTRSLMITIMHLFSLAPCRLRNRKGGLPTVVCSRLQKLKTVSKCLKACPIYCSLAIGPPPNWVSPPFSTQSPGTVPHLLQQFKTTLPKYLLSFKWVKRRKCLTVYLGGQVVYGLCN